MKQEILDFCRKNEMDAWPVPGGILLENSNIKLVKEKFDVECENDGINWFIKC